MAENTLSEVERLLEQLSPLEQARLLTSLALRIEQRAKSGLQSSVGSTEGGEDAWAEVVRIGESLAADDSPDLPTLTSAVVSMRR